MNPENAVPVIKGVFVNSHIKKLKDVKGVKAVEELKKKYGKPMKFGFLESVPVKEEVIIIELVLDLLENHSFPEAERAFEAGRLHFNNFRGTPFARMMFAALPKDFKVFMKAIPNIAGRVFKNVKFTGIDLGPNAVKIIMENNDYPLEHFKGLYYEWMNYFGLKGNVKAEETALKKYEYTMTWE